MKALKTICSVIGWGVAVLAGLFIVTTLLAVVAIVSKGVLSEDLTVVKTEHAVSVVEVTGEILSSDKFRRALEKRVKNDKIKAIVVRVDSPGGAVGASEEIYEAVKRADEKKPIVCSLGNMAASGGLYAAMGCREVFTNRSTLTGSIGAVFMIPNVETIIDHVGLGFKVIKSGKFKDAGSPFRPMSKDEESLFQALVDEAYEQFVQVVAEARGLEIEKVKEFADGRVIIGSMAVELGLADRVGSLSDAAKRALELTGDTAEPEIILPRKRSGILGMLGDLDESKLGFFLRALDRGQLLYRSQL